LYKHTFDANKVLQHIIFLIRAFKTYFALYLRELDNGIEVYDENKNLLGESQLAARQGISAVVLSRIVMSAPGMSKA